MRILVLSDTHIPRTASDLPQQIYNEIENVDMILHAGDFVEKELYDKLAILRDLRAVYGNMDSAELREKLHEKEVIQVGAVKIGLMHGYGAPRDILETVRKEFKGVDAVVYGHSHSSVNIVKDGVLFFNPGSPTDKIFAASNTYGILEITGKSIIGKIVKIEDRSS